MELKELLSLAAIIESVEDQQNDQRESIWYRFERRKI